MNIIVKSLFVITASVLCMQTAKADKIPCPKGCFCLNDGQYEADPIIYKGVSWRGRDEQESAKKGIDQIAALCRTSTPVLSDAKYTCLDTGYMVIGKFSIVCNRKKYLQDEPGDVFNYILDEFSEFYYDEWDTYFGGYGKKGNNIIYFPRTPYMQRVFRCPETHPESEPGAKSLVDCFAYTVGYEKIYYGTKRTITCDSGEYLPANSTQCNKCILERYICNGGTFDFSATKDQGITPKQDAMGNDIINPATDFATDIAKKMISAGITKPITNSQQNNNTNNNSGLFMPASKQIKQPVDNKSFKFKIK